MARGDRIPPSDVPYTQSHIARHPTTLRQVERQAREVKRSPTSG